jgi:hypothetical protein
LNQADPRRRKQNVSSRPDFCPGNTSTSEFCDCKVWISRDDATPSYIFFGFEADTALASYLFTVIDRAMRTELSAFRIAHPRLGGVRLREASKSFQQGIPARVADRLD